MATKPPPFADMYFESTINFSTRDTTVKEKGHFCSDWKTSDMWCVEGKQSGTYLAWQLHARPHSQFPSSYRDIMKKKCDDADIHFHLLQKKRVVEKNNFLHFTDESIEFEEGILPIKDEFELDNIVKLLLDQGDNERDVGNVTVSKGWCGYNYGRTKEQEVVTPRHSKIDIVDAKYLILLTKVYNKVHRKHLDHTPYNCDIDRVKEYALQLLHLGGETELYDENNEPRNIFEALTYALTFIGDNEQHLKCHVDKFNDRCQGFDIVEAIYFHHFYKPLGKWVRVVIIGYMRKTVKELINRKNNYQYIKQNLVEYKNGLGVRMRFELENAIPKTMSGQHMFRYTLPFIDKSAFYSLFIDSIRVYCKFMMKKRSIYLEDLIELIAPIGQLNTARCYCLLLRDWIAKDYLPKGNLAVNIFDGLVKMFGGIYNTEAKRCQPFCNKDLSLEQVYNNLKIIHNVIMDANSKLPSEEQHIHLLTNLQKMHFVGHLSSQHLLSIMSLLRIIKHTYYADHAKLALKNKTKTNFDKKFSLNPETMNRIYNQIADDHFDGKTQMSENLGCEFLRDMLQFFPEDYSKENYFSSIAKRCKNIPIFPDVFYGKQKIYKVVNGIVMEYWWKNKEKQERKSKDWSFLHIDETRNWVVEDSSQFSSIVVKTSSKKRLPKTKKKSNEQNQKSKVSRKTKKSKAKSVKSNNKDNQPMKSDRSVSAPNDEEILTVQFSHMKIVEIDTNFRDIVEIDSDSEDDGEDQYYFNEAKLCDEYDPSEPIPIEFDREQSKLIELLEKVDPNMNDNSDFNSIANKAFGSSFFDGTVKTINVGQICQKITGSPKGKNNKYQTYEIQKGPNNTYFHSISLRGSKGMVFVSSEDWTVYDKGWVGFYMNSKVYQKNKLVAFYDNKADALKATQLRCLTQNASTNMKDDEKCPSWVTNILPKDSYKKQVALYEIKQEKKDGKLQKRMIFFGLLSLNEDESYTLLVPRDENINALREWQSFYFSKN